MALEYIVQLLNILTWRSSWTAPRQVDRHERIPTLLAQKKKSANQRSTVRGSIRNSPKAHGRHGRSPQRSIQSRYFLRSSRSAQPANTGLIATSSTVRKSTAAIAQATGETVFIAKRVFTFDELPKWMQEDPYIRHGYRNPSNSFQACFWSLFYPHNELVNTWSHLLPAMLFLVLFLAVDCTDLGGGIKVSWQDNLMMQIYVAGTACCLFLSAMFHCSNAHSEPVARRCLKLDYLGIVLTISTTCISATYFGLYSHARLQALYIALTFVCAVAIFHLTLRPHADGPGAAAWRAAVFIVLALSGFVPIAHVGIAEGHEGLQRFPLWSIALTCGSYLVGTGFYIHRVPEKVWPEVFDVWGASHQIFHVLVVFGQFVHFLGLRNVLWLQYNQAELLT